MQIEINDLIKSLINNTLEKDLRIDNAFSLYLNYQKITNSEGTYKYVESYFKLINKYLTLNNINMISQLNNEFFLNYISYLKNRKLKNGSINKHIKLIKAVLNWLSKNDICNVQKITIDNLKETEPETIIINQNDIKRIYDYSKTLSIKSQIIILLLITTGIRTAEITRLKIKDINLIDKQIYLEDSKTRKPRYLFITDELYKLLKLYIGNTKTYLFESSDNQPIKARSIADIINRIKKKLNIDKLSPHKFRHTFASSIYKNTHDIESTRLLLGHSNYNMTKRYITLETKKLKDTNNNFNPLALIK